MTKSELQSYQRVFSWDHIMALVYDAQRNKIAAMFDDFSWSDFTELEQEKTIDMDGNPCTAYFFLANYERIYLHNVELITKQ